ncbi:MAG: sugar transferase [Clostridia bacterium]|nr:sugar transferase [Clostridia bacterium]
MYRVIKRLFDVLASALAIILLIPLWAVIALIIKIQSPGPAVYRARRVGLNGKIFTLYKFRTMLVDSGKIHTTTLNCDLRVFPFGAFLRKSKLDETLQLINIIKNDMSVIGPRPEDVDNADTMFIGDYQAIFSVKPGLSSPASLYDYTHGERYSLEDEYEKEFLPQKLYLELYYVNHMSVSYDIQIIFRTVKTIVLVMYGKELIKKPWELLSIYDSVKPADLQYNEKL